ncbi:MAG: Ig-like domain-containing protein [Saprospiraceae bacterium]|nr:Ig-like domain-containing protein [Saprospiraceae bacterium]
MNKKNSILITMLMAIFISLSMSAFGTTPTTSLHTEKRPLAGCDGVTITGGSNSITITGLGTYSHIQVFTPGFAAQVFDREINSATLTVPIATPGAYIVKVWSNPDPTAFCENNFPVTVGGGATVPPVANPDNVTTPQATPVTIVVLGNDNLNGGTLQTVTLVSNPANGTVTLNSANKYIYTPNAGFSGTDQFTYRIVASNGTSNTTTVTITVPSAQAAPVANPDNVSTNQNIAVTIPVLNNDVVNGTLTMLVVMSQPTNGTATVSGNQIIYTPRAGFCGTDNFTYKLVTSTGSSTSSVAVNVACGAAPVANPDNTTTPRNTPVTIAVLGNDNLNGGTVQAVALVSSPSNGTVALNASNQYVYTPNAGFSGTDQFTYRIVASNGTSNTTTVTITVPAATSAPVANPDNTTTPQNTPVTIAVLGNDNLNGGTVQAVALVSSPSNGTVALNASNQYVYTPNTGFSGTDQFTYRIVGSNGTSNTTTVTITVPAATSAPVANPDNTTTPQNTPVTIAVLGNDNLNGGTVQAVALVSSPSNGTVALNASNQYVYTPNTGFSGTDQFTYRIVGSNGTSNTTTVTVTVPAATSAPVANPDNTTTPQNTPVTIAVLGNDNLNGGTVQAVALVSSPSNGTVALNASNQYVYTPNAGFSGTDQFTYRIVGSNGTSNTTTVTITVPSASAAPVAVPDIATTPQSTPVTITVLGNDNLNGGTLQMVMLVSNPANGTVSLNGSNQYVYTSNAGYTGIDQFRYKVVASNGTSNTTTVTVVVASPSAPIAVPDNVLTPQNTPVTIAVLGNDNLNGGTLQSVNLVSNPANGTVSLNGSNQYVYTPNAGFTGIDQFTYRIVGTNGTSNTATVTVAVPALPSAAPVAVPDIALTPQATPVTIAVLGNDNLNGGTLQSVNLVSNPANGTVVLNGSNQYVYTPNAGFTGTDQFTYRIVGTNGTSNTTTATIAVIASPLAPIAVPDNALTPQNTPVTIAVLGNDNLNGGTLQSVNLVSNPTNGTVSLNASNQYVYTPNAAFSGTDQFTYRIVGSNGTSNTATVTVTVPAAPVANPDNRTTPQNTPVTIAVLGNDNLNGGTLQAVALVSNPANGTVSLNGSNQYVYTPNAGFSGTDQFTYRVIASNGTSNTTTVTITVPVAQPTPVANPDNATTPQSTPVTIAVLGNDNLNGGTLQAVALVSNPANGTVSLNGSNQYVYTPNAGFSGTDQFTYRVIASNGTSNTTTVTITVPVAQPTPVANPDNATTPQSTPVTIAVLGNDNLNGGTLQAVALVSNPANGTVSLNGSNQYVYTPNAGFSGTDQFTYRVLASNGTSNTTTVTVTVPVAQPTPVANPDNATTPQSTPVTIAVLGNDNLNGGTLQSVNLVSNPANGTVTLNGSNQYVYTPNAGFSGTDQFTYRVIASNGTSNTTTVTVTVPAATSAPVANPDSTTTPQNTPVAIAILGNDNLNGGTVQAVTLISGPANGSVSLNVLNQNVSTVYTPNAGFSGTDQFTYRIVASNGTSNTTTVTITVPATTSAPVANPDNAATPRNTPVTIPVLGNDNLNGGTLQMVMLVSNPANGTVTLNGSNQYVYTPNAGFTGTNQFTYKVVASNGTSNTTTVTVTVPAATSAPVANPDSTSTPRNTPVTIAVLGNDNLNGGTLQMVMLVSNPANGTVTLNGSNQYVYTPNAGFTGTNQFTYKVVASNGTSNTTTVTVTVPAAPATPVANPDSTSTPRNTPVTIAVLGNDNLNGGTLQMVMLVSNPANGTVTLNGSNQYVYTPNAGFTGTNQFTYKVVASNGTSNTTTVTVTVPAAPATPVANPDNASTPRNTRVTIAVLGNDNLNGGTLQMVMLVSNPANGTVTLNASNQYVYTPNAGFTGTNQFTYKVVASNGTSNTTTVTVNVTNGPIANPDNVTVLQGRPVTIAVLANDNSNGGRLRMVMLVSNPANGTVSLNSSNQYVYTSNAGFSGTDQFTYKVVASNGTSNTATVTVRVLAAGDPCLNDVTRPVITCPANMVKTPTDAGTCWRNITWNPATATDNCSTPTVTQISGPTSGSCIGYGVSTVCYKATDARGNSAVCSLTVTINRPTGSTCTNPTVNFKNGTNCSLSLYWIDSNGKKKWYKSISAGATHAQSTYPGHRWLMCTSKGSVVYDYKVTSNCTQTATASSCSNGWWFLATADVLTLEARAEVNRNRIDFVNNTGIQNDYLTVEKVNQASGDFETLELVNNKSNTNENEYYSVYDNNPVEGDNTYRVKVTYLDGSTKISDAKTVSSKTSQGVSVYPNPAVETVSVDLSKYKGQAVTILLYNTFGQQVLTHSVDNASGSLNLDIAQFTAGNYRLRVVSKGRKDVIQQLNIAK